MAQKQTMERQNQIYNKHMQNYAGPE